MFRLVPPVPSPEARHVFCSVPPTGREASSQMELLMKENEKLKQELEGHAEKALRIQKVRSVFRRRKPYFIHETNRSKGDALPVPSHTRR